MIKEKRKKGKYHNELTLKQELLGYLRTAGLALITGSLITLLLSFHARSEMIKNLANAKNEKGRIDRQIAQQITAETDLTASLQNRDYKICMYVGSIYEAAGDYIRAEYSYTLAKNKAGLKTFSPYYKLVEVLVAQDKFSDAQDVINSVIDIKDKDMIKFKTRAYIVMGDKYNSLDKYLKAAECFEQADYYYNRFSKKDKIVDQAIKQRLADAYINTADVMVKNGYNSDAVNFLKKAQKYKPNDYIINYKLAIIYADLDPIVSIEYFEPLLEKIPQKIDYDIYNRVLMKAANISDLEGNSIKSKYYRYRIHSIDIFIKNKVIYKNDVDVILNNFDAKKVLFSYHLYTKFKFINNSSTDLNKLYAEFVLKNKDKVKENVVVQCASKKKPLLSNGGESENIEVNFGKNIFTKKELSNYKIEVYLYKDEKFKTYIGSYKVPVK